MTNLDARLISSNADEVTAKAMQHPVLVRYAKLKIKSKENAGTRIKARAGMYLYTAIAGADTYEISEEQDQDGYYTGTWKIELDQERQHVFTINTLKDAIATIGYWTNIS